MLLIEINLHFEREELLGHLDRLPKHKIVGSHISAKKKKKKLSPHLPSRSFEVQINYMLHIEFNKTLSITIYRSKHSMNRKITIVHHGLFDVTHFYYERLGRQFHNNEIDN